MTLPLGQGRATDEPAGASGTGEDDAHRTPGDGGDGRPLRILLADDNEDVTWTQASVLAAHGFEVRTASDGEGALAIAPEFRPDVALLDIAMGGTSGLEVARQIRAAPWGDGMLLIAATGWGTDADRQKSMEAGFDEHLVKPVNLEWLIGRLAAHGEAGARQER
jgi:two-component system CheB/CheR fusion protein